MPLTLGTKLGADEILAPLGAGGRGEVYRAKDTRLDRDVVIKVLPADFANDADRLKRFEQEAQATSALNHPNILTIYDSGNHESGPYIVAELLEDVSADGQKILLLRPLKDATTRPLTVAQNWTALLKQ